VSGTVSVNVAVVTALSVIPDLKALALTVAELVRIKGAEYTVELPVGLLPSVV
jgi:hypothetical protein